MKIGEVTEVIGGGTPSRKNPEYFKGNIIWLTPTQIPRKKITVVNSSIEMITEEGLQKSSAKIIPKNSVLLTSRATIGNVAIAGKEVSTNQGFASFVCSEEINNQFLAYWLFANRQMLVDNSKGTTFKEISKSKIKELSIHVPPLTEQKIIVRKIEEMLSLIENKEKIIFLSQKNLLEMKKSVLNQAFSGKLVPQNPDEKLITGFIEKIKTEN